MTKPAADTLFSSAELNALIVNAVREFATEAIQIAERPGKLSVLQSGLYRHHKAACIRTSGLKTPSRSSPTAPAPRLCAPASRSTDISMNPPLTAS